ncbi:MAG: MIP/aquaporin family protein [Acidimicrobiia bacterium]
MPLFSRKLAAEFLGSFVLLGMGGFAIFSANVAPGANGVQGTPLLIIAFGFGFALLAGLYAFGEVSGGHFNPAVSLGAFIDKRIDLMTLFAYAVVQILGFIVAGALLAYAVSTEFVATTATLPGQGVSDMDAFLLEALFTAIFVAVILKVTASEQFGATALVAISLTLIAIHLALVPITGASVNPGRTLGSAVAGGEWTSIWIYLTAPFVGSFFGWAFYKLVTLEPSSD